MTGHITHFLPATNIIGGKVKNAQGESLGKIENLMVNLLSIRVTYAVLSFGGFLGLGENTLQSPWRQWPWTPRTRFSFSMSPKKNWMKPMVLTKLTGRIWPIDNGKRVFTSITT